MKLIEAFFQAPSSTLSSLLLHLKDKLLLFPQLRHRASVWYIYQSGSVQAARPLSNVCKLYSDGNSVGPSFSRSLLQPESPESWYHLGQSPSAPLTTGEAPEPKPPAGYLTANLKDAPDSLKLASENNHSLVLSCLAKVVRDTCFLLGFRLEIFLPFRSFAFSL